MPRITPPTTSMTHSTCMSSFLWTHQCYLRFALDTQHYQVIVLLFGLATAPRISTKVLAHFLALLCSLDIMGYLDDHLLREQKIQTLSVNVQWTAQTLQRYGWILISRNQQFLAHPIGLTSFISCHWLSFLVLELRSLTDWSMAYLFCHSSFCFTSCHIYAELCIAVALSLTYI